MNKAAKLISETIRNGSSKTIQLGSSTYTVNAPSIWVIARMLDSLSDVSVKDCSRVVDVIASIPQHSQYIAKAIAVAIVGDTGSRWNIRGAMRIRSIRRKISHCTPTEMKEAFEIILSLIYAQDFFDCANLAEELAKQMAKPKP